MPIVSNVKKAQLKQKTNAFAISIYTLKNVNTII